ncbi:MAG: mechanosensitive ion channel family protein [Candidatus Marsarchaeota archaeon]|nr:mechanosensitive ion channel family protein [Candidatus Marsarchaeota archaeon]
MILTDIAWIIFLIIIFLVIAKILEKIFGRIFTLKELKTDINVLKKAEKSLISLLSFIALYIGVSTTTEFNLPALFMFIKVMIILSGAYFFIEIGNIIIEHESKITKRAVFTDFSNTLSKLWDLFIIIVAMTILMSFFGIEVTAVIASLGIAGLAIGLALQDVLSNFFSGISMGSDKSIRTGDYVKLDNGLEGYVDHMTWRNVRLKTLDNNYIFIPNLKFSQSAVTNYFFREKELSLSIPLSISYDSDLDKVEKITVETAKEVIKNNIGAVQDYSPTIRYSSFGDSGINFSLNVKCKTYTDKYLLTHELIKAIHKRYKKEDIEIPYPITEVHVKK